MRTWTLWMWVQLYVFNAWVRDSCNRRWYIVIDIVTNPSSSYSLASIGDVGTRVRFLQIPNPSHSRRHKQVSDTYSTDRVQAISVAPLPLYEFFVYSFAIHACNDPRCIAIERTAKGKTYCIQKEREFTNKLRYQRLLRRRQMDIVIQLEPSYTVNEAPTTGSDKMLLNLDTQTHAQTHTPSLHMRADTHVTTQLHCMLTALHA